jgi:DNA (cytosine-5)-methyltransferase 1
MKNKHTVVDLFAGVGGLSLGFKENDFDLVFANDIDEDASKTFTYNHPKTKFFLGDVKELTENKIKRLIGNTKVDVLVGGVPCQSFSMVGYRTTKKEANLDDPRHYLFREFIRVAKILNPKIIIIENVKAILSSHKGKIKDEIISKLKEIGYDVDYEILNAADFGNSQLRERAIFIGNKLGIPNNFPKKTHSPDNYVTIAEIFSNIPLANHEPKQLSGKVLERVKLIKPGNNWKSLPIELQTGSKHSGAYGRLDPNKPSRTLTTRFDTPPGGYVTHPIENRAITVREGARIQGFPDDFIFIGKRISQYRQVGNAVAVGMSRALAKSVKEMLNDQK